MFELGGDDENHPLKNCLDTQEPGLLKSAVKRKSLKAMCFDVAGSNRGFELALL